MSAGTLSEKACKSCNEMFRRGTDNKIKEDYCSNCTTKGWQQEMYDAGCNVVHPKNMGNQAHVVNVKPKDCPKVILNGEVYRDITDLLYEDTKYKNTYPTKKEWNKIRAHEYRKARVKQNNKVPIEEKMTRIGFKYTDEAIERMVEMARAGEKDYAIAKAVGTNQRSVYMKLRDLRKRGVEC